MAKKKPQDKPPKRTPPAEREPKGYAAFLSELKQRIRTAQIRASLAVNQELISLYWQTGRDIVERQKTHRWGNAVLDRLGEDLQKAFPGLSGFSQTNLYRMRAFYLAYRDAAEIVPQAVGQIAEGGLPEAVAVIPWGHNVVLIEQVKDPAARLWYARQAVENGWSRAVMVHWIESDLHGRRGKASTNFEKTLPKLESDLARETLKDP
jgi:predicted nuclease of restriction endonuclease-like (RecB) superfamily